MAVSTIDPNGLNIGQIGGTRNKIVNGSMTIDQRNAGAAVSLSGLAVTYTLDRWAIRNDADAVVSVQQSSTAPTGFSNSLLYTVTTADASLGSTQNYSVQHRVEGFNMTDFGWGSASAQPVTLSFWVRSSLTGTFGGAISNSSVNRSYPFTYSISVADTWEYKTVIIAGDTSGTWLKTNGLGAYIYFSTGAGSTFTGSAGAWAAADYRGATGETSIVGTNGATFYVTGVQLEAGDTATPFEHRSYGAELALCQRYFQQFDVFPGPSFASFIGYYGGSNVLSPVQRLSVPMRVTPTIAIANSGVEYYSFGLAWTGTTLTAIPRSSEMYYIYCATDADGRGKLLRNGSSGAGPNPIASFSAEL